MTSTQRLLVRLRDEVGLDIPEGASILRTYAGWRQLVGGAWSWYVVGPDGVELRPPVGSPYPVTALLRKSGLAINGRRLGYHEIGEG